MRQTIQRWHAGQLIMVWVIGAAVLLALGVRTERGFGPYRRWHTFMTTRDSFAALYTSDSGRSAALIGSAGVTPEQVALLFKSSGMGREQIAAWFLTTGISAPPGIEPPPGPAYFITGAVALLVVLAMLWWATWVWFAGRATRSPPAGSG